MAFYNLYFDKPLKLRRTAPHRELHDEQSFIGALTARPPWTLLMENYKEAVFVAEYKAYLKPMISYNYLLL